MNSWKSVESIACFPPLRMFTSGTGRVRAAVPPRYRYSGNPTDSAAAWATARLTPRSAFAPSFDLFSVPSRLIRRRSRLTWSDASMPRSSGRIVSFTWRTALRTPLPPYRAASPSRSSTAS